MVAELHDLGTYIMENCVLSMESTIGTLTGQLSTLSGEIQRLLQVVR
jgi:hypothetical protein